MVQYDYSGPWIIAVKTDINYLNLFDILEAFTQHFMQIENQIICDGVVSHWILIIHTFQRKRCVSIAFTESTLGPFSQHLNLNYSNLETVREHYAHSIFWWWLTGHSFTGGMPSCSKLQKLVLDNNLLVNTGGLESLPSLHHLSCIGNHLPRVSNLTNSPLLQYLNLQQNNLCEVNTVCVCV